jgi:hypothetical protein
MPPRASWQIDDCAASEGHSHTLVHPETGLANDYLNIFNELIMLVEQLPSMPEFVDDVLGWSPVSYVDYFQRSSLPGSQQALELYRGLDASFRHRFELAVVELDKAADAALAGVQAHLHRFGDGHPGGLEKLCVKASATLRDLLNRAANIVNDNEQDAGETAQHRADRLLAAHGHSLTTF